MRKDRRAYIKNMDWKEKLKWKMIIILMALAGIGLLWYGKSSEKEPKARGEILREYVLRENEWASAGAAYPAGAQGETENREEQTGGNTQAKTEEAREEPKRVQEDLQEEIPAAEEASEELEEETRIRVLLMDTGYKSYYHDKIVLSFQGAYTLEAGEESREIGSGETLELTAGSPELSKGRLCLTPKEGENKIQLLSLERGVGNPSYEGSLEIAQDERGLYLVNELPLESYLCGVVPSEMPASYPREALKAQAVCARTYACVQMRGDSLAEWNAQVDDSVSYQVYNNSVQAEASSQAVEETKGEILLSQGEPINAYYFSTSHGRTSTDEVWEASAPAGYLQSVECSYDSAEPWYQWSVELPAKQLLENAKGLFSDVSAVEGLEIREKGEGEAVLDLAVYTDAGEKEIHSEYDIRTLLAPSGLSVTRQDGSTVKGSSLLPSAYFSLEEQRDEQGKLTGCRILGGGYGHGVGMSQNGAKGMANAGKNYEEILNYFYKDVEIGNIRDTK